MTATASPAAPTRCVVVGGGAVGGLVTRLLADAGHHVDVVDPAGDPEIGRRFAGPGVRFVSGDITDPGPRLVSRLGRAGTVVLAVPERVALAALDGVVDAMADGALLVDTLSVKGRIVPAVRAASARLEAVSLNPMFAPALGVAGRPVATVVVRDGPRARELLRLIGAWGGRVVPVSAAEHDRVAAAVQVLPHAAILAFGLALAELDVDIATLDALAPPPHRALLALVARIVGGAPEVYWDVQSANTAGGPARDRLADAVRHLATAVDRDDRAEFRAVLLRLRDFIGADLGRYREACARAFVAMDRVTDGP